LWNGLHSRGIELRRTWIISILLAASFGLISLGNARRVPPINVQDDLQVMVPVPLQILGAFGDRYFAANVGTWRAIMVSPRQLSPDELTALAQIQETVSWLNPGHEDNYYTATAILPWAGKTDSTQRILERATENRPHDPFAPFFYAFNALHFYQDRTGASQALLVAASHATDPGDKQGLTVLAAQWLEKGNDLSNTQRIVLQMARDTRDPALRAHLTHRAERLAGLIMLREATQHYEIKYGHPLEDLNQLVSSGIIEKLPTDPFGDGYALSGHQPVFAPSR
jgi:hypothetical protein